MRLSRICIQNYRNFRSVDFRLAQHAVFLGENGAGKSNFFRALRLLLDPELPDAERYLDAEDFWTGTQPFAGNEVVISVELTGFEDEEAVLACLSDYQVEPYEGSNSPVARLTYKYFPSNSELEPESLSKHDYKFAIYGGDDVANEVSRDCRRWVSLKVLGALRDAASDLRTWKRSPLRPLLDEVSTKLDADALNGVANEIDGAASTILEEEPIKELRSSILVRIREMIGLQHSLEPSFGFASTDTSRLLQSLRLFADSERRWGIGELSLGLANVLYLALLLLQVQRQEESNRTAALLLAIEEPEAHLHPQLQRLLFRDLLKRSQPLLVSTHSPNIASVAPIDSFVSIKSNGEETSVHSVADSATFSASETDDLQRYLDVTRSEVLFARGVILVEGIAEQFVVPAAAELLQPSISLDEYGISVCPVGGTDFSPFAKLLGSLGIPYVVVTDGDPQQSQGMTIYSGLARGCDILDAVGSGSTRVKQLLAVGDVGRASRVLGEAGIFVGSRTLEVDMLQKGAGPRMARAYSELRPRARSLPLFSSTGDVTEERGNKVLSLIEDVGKGRFSQRLVSHLVRADIPDHISAAVQFIVRQVARVSL